MELEILRIRHHKRSNLKKNIFWCKIKLVSKLLALKFAIIPKKVGKKVVFKLYALKLILYKNLTWNPRSLQSSLLDEYQRHQLSKE